MTVQAWRQEKIDAFIEVVSRYPGSVAALAHAFVEECLPALDEQHPASTKDPFYETVWAEWSEFSAWERREAFDRLSNIVKAQLIAALAELTKRARAADQERA